jgi:rSAM/selenodomain-associated transferase 2
LISIVVPVLNEEKKISNLLSHLQVFREQGHEIIVVDGGSRDNSLMLAQGSADSVIVSRSGRALQMNSGASIAKGNVFLFLHSDTVLPDDALQLISNNVQRPFWGRFDIRLSSDKFIFRVIETFINLRSRLTSINTGDQAIFVDSQLFHSVGGFPEIALMEDIAISKKLKSITSPICLKRRVITSSRRWENRGVITTVLLMWKLRLYYFFGVSPDKLNQLYR